MLKLNYVNRDGKEKTITKVSHGIKDIRKTLNYSKKMAEIYENKELNVPLDEEKGVYIKLPEFYLAELDLASDYLLEVFAEDGLTKEILEDEISISHEEFFDVVNDVQQQIMGGQESEEKKQMETTL